MNDLRTSAQQALKALEDFGMKHYLHTGEVLHKDVYESLKAALAEPENWELRRLREELERCKQVCAATSEAWREEAA